MKRKYLLIFPLEFIILFLLVSCHERNIRNTNPQTLSYKAIASIDTLKKPFVNVYIENSGSMDGYVNGNSEFRGAIRDLMVLLKHHYGANGEIKIHFINNVIRETDTKIDLATFASSINQYWKVQDDDRSSSNLNNVFKMILEKTDKNTISILFSDCIYSISGKNAEGLLADEKSLTKDAFLSRWRQDSLKLATTIVKMKSKFKGTYYDKDNRLIPISNRTRPYYICIIGNIDLMSGFNSKIPLTKESIEGFDNKYFISTGKSDDLYYSVLLSTENYGRFKPNRSYSSKEYVHGIEDIDLRSGNRREGVNNRFTFAIAVNMKNIPVEDDYLLNPQNFSLGDDNFKIKAIKVIDKKDISPSDWLRINLGNPTHLIVLEANGTALSDVKVSMKKQMPQWIEYTNIIDDSNINANLDKTFGIKYLIEGIGEAYNTIYPDDKNFFEFEIKISQ